MSACISGGKTAEDTTDEAEVVEGVGWGRDKDITKREKYGYFRDETESNPAIEDITTVLPGIESSVIEQDGETILRLIMMGIQDPVTKDWVQLKGSNMPDRNLWVEIDGNPMYNEAYNLNGSNMQMKVPVDLVFLVDNSGSMDDEANAIARDIIEWSKSLANQGFDVRYACVGYGGYISGAIDFTNETALSTWLQEGEGTSRTMGFAGNNASTLRNAASRYALSNDVDIYECGMAALRFADENFTFRNGADRIYINFTDEANQNVGKSRFSVESLQTDWDATRGTIHTVFSDSPADDRGESNARMSELTGGTVIYTDPYFTNVSLPSLPVTQAMTNAHVIDVWNAKKYVDGQPHDLRLTIRTPDGHVQTERRYNMIF